MARKPKTPARHAKPKKQVIDNANEGWDLCLYVAGQTPKSIQAITNLRQLCENELNGQYRIKVVDLAEKPQLARTDQIVAIPTLVRRVPMPIRKIIGDLSNKERVLVGLYMDIKEQ